MYSRFLAGSRRRSGSLLRHAWLLPGLAALLVLPLPGCQKPLPREGGIADLAPLDIAPGARHFRLQADQSQLTVLVYRDGRLANLGHNHVISSDDLHGEIYLADALQNSAFEIRLPVMTMVVDAPQNRANAGDDFPRELDPDAISGTRANMLGEQQLDAEMWPEIVLRSRVMRGVLPDYTVQVDIAVRSRIHSLEIPVHVVVTGDRIIATGSFSVNQTDLGLEPFSVMMGALTVRDQLDINFSLVAEADRTTI